MCNITNRNKARQYIAELLNNSSFNVHKCGLSTPPHSERYTITSPFGRIMLGIKGTLIVEQMDKTYYLKSSTAILVPPNTRVTFTHSPNTKFYWLYYNVYYNNAIDIFEFIFIPSAKLIIRKASAMLPPFKKLIKAYNSNKPESQFEVIGNLALLLKPFMSAQNNNCYQDRFIELTRILPVIRYIDTHISSPISITELAKIAHLSPVYFSNLFSKTMDISPLQYIIRRRIIRAKEFLLFTDMPISEIARQVGIEDAFYFSRIFKRKEGISPMQYRKIFQKDFIAHPKTSKTHYL